MDRSRIVVHAGMEGSTSFDIQMVLHHNFVLHCISFLASLHGITQTSQTFYELITTT